MVGENVKGWFDVVKDISIYLENPKDKEALKTAKRLIKEIQNRSNSVDYSSLFTMLGSRNQKSENFEIINKSDNVYLLKKVNNNKK